MRPDDAAKVLRQYARTLYHLGHVGADDTRQEEAERKADIMFEDFDRVLDALVPTSAKKAPTVEEGIWREFMSPWRGYRDHVCAMSAFVHPSGFWFEVSDFALVMFSASIAAHLRRSAEVAIEGGATGLHMAEVERIIDDGGVTGWSVVWRRVEAP
jgi:hypothetical protein